MGSYEVQTCSRCTGTRKSGINNECPACHGRGKIAYKNGRLLTGSEADRVAGPKKIVIGKLHYREWTVHEPTQPDNRPI